MAEVGSLRLQRRRQVGHHLFHLFFHPRPDDLPVGVDTGLTGDEQKLSGLHDVRVRPRLRLRKPRRIVSFQFLSGGRDNGHQEQRHDGNGGCHELSFTTTKLIVMNARLAGHPRGTWAASAARSVVLPAPGPPVTMT